MANPCSGRRSLEFVRRRRCSNHPDRPAVHDFRCHEAAQRSMRSWRLLMRYSTTQAELKRLEAIELPSIESLPQVKCILCGKPKIMGLFTPLEHQRDGGPRCRMCIGEV